MNEGSAPSRESEFNRASGRLNQELKNLHQAIDMLRERISRAMRPEPSTNAKITSEPDMSSPLAREVFSQAQELGACVAEINEIITRLEI
jgi:hypothetical protein